MFHLLTEGGVEPEGEMVGAQRDNCSLMFLVSPTENTGESPQCLWSLISLK